VTKDTDNLAWKGCSTDSLAIEAVDYSSTGGTLNFKWKIDCYLLYTFEAYINGPKGVPWK